MSEYSLISPLLDGFTMGHSMAEHDGVCCCPAIKEDSDKKYIVKIITVPASQVQLDALLLAGAYKDPADAMEYFRQIGEDILKEAEFLKELSRLDGFLSYENWQMVPITRKRLGYQVYLVGSYKRSLEKHLRRNPVTHLEAINLCLDLCAALSVCRQAGYLYADLKPANIFVSDKKQYRIGDLGFLSLNALRYTALPRKYQSAYTPPELFDPMAPLNLTVDTYAVGMILYRLYNDGQLPARTGAAGETLPTPVNADYELAEIIMKAIHPDPEQRWTDPADMGKALASYMQRNAVNDVPITPHTPLEISTPASAPAVEETPQATEEPVENTAAESAEQPEEEPAVAVLPETEPEPLPEEIPEEPEDTLSEVSEAPEADEESEEPAYYREEPEEYLPDEPDDSEEPEESEETQEPEKPYDEFAGIMAKAEDFLQHTPPVGVVLPDPPRKEDPFAFVLEDSEEIDDSDIPLDPVMEDEDAPPVKKDTSGKKKSEQKFADPKYKRRTKRFVHTLIALVLLCLVGFAGFWYYQNFYLQEIQHINITGGKDQLTVVVSSDVKESLLKVTCSDNYGYSKTQPLSGGTAIFTDLNPSTLYNVQVDIDGFHRLIGKTCDIFTTDATTNILSFSSLAGHRDGSLVLNFTVEGEEPDRWTLHYFTENEEPREERFEGHSVSVSDLSIGKTYTLTLDAGKDLTLGGMKSIQVTASRLIQAKNITVSPSGDTDIVVHWDAPGDVLVDSWNVRCYDEKGYDEEMTVTDTQAAFVGITPSSSYTFEVTAAGMTQPTRAGITANPIRIKNMSVNDSSPKKLVLNWEYQGNKSVGSWLLNYTVDGGEKTTLKCDKSSAEITPRIPGAKYTFTLQTTDGTSVLGGTHTYTCPEADGFDKYNFSLQTLQADLLKTPEQSNWRCENLPADTYTDTFSVGDNISVALRNSESFYLPGSEVEILYVVEDAYGNVLPEYTAAQKAYWKNIWTPGDPKNGELNLPRVPATPGSYVLKLYMDCLKLAELPFSMH